MSGSLKARQRSPTKLSPLNSRIVTPAISDLSPRGINGSFGMASIGNSRRRCELGTSPAKYAVRPQRNAIRPRPASAIASAKTVYAVERLARSDRRLAATVDQWDADPWQLNTPQGVVDLTTGQARPHVPEDYFTKITAVGPQGGCPRFLAFLDRITGGDAELVAYLRRVLGYGLTGLTREHALFFGYGTGANGKSVLLSTVAGILDEYHKTAPIETFTASNGDRHPTDLASLRGARLVTATETEEGRRWAESRIKQLTGGDTVAARFMRQDFFEYRPAFKLIIAGNHKPSLRSVDEAIRRRFHLIPFAVTIPARGARRRSRREAQGRMARGSSHGSSRDAWNGKPKALVPPRAVLEATEAYLSAEDAIAAWIEEKCEVDAKHGSRRANCLHRGLPGLTQRASIRAHEAHSPKVSKSRGFHRHRMPHGQRFYGLRFKSRSYAPLNLG